MHVSTNPISSIIRDNGTLAGLYIALWLLPTQTSIQLLVNGIAFRLRMCALCALGAYSFTAAMFYVLKHFIHNESFLAYYVLPFTVSALSVIVIVCAIPTFVHRIFGQQCLYVMRKRTL